jgi:hypothetical protein
VQVLLLQEDLASSREVFQEQAERGSQLESALGVAQAAVTQLEQDVRLAAGSAGEAHNALAAEVGALLHY